MADALLAIQQGRSQQHDEYGFLKRSPWFPLIFAPAVLICGVSWLAGGIVILTDLGFGLLTVALLGMLVNELRVFGHRYGIGGILLAFGSLLIFCHPRSEDDDSTFGRNPPRFHLQRSTVLISY